MKIKEPKLILIHPVQLAKAILWDIRTKVFQRKEKKLTLKRRETFLK